MYQIDFSKPCNVHFIGIGGISMSGFARLLSSMGFTVSGSDRIESAVTRQLSDLGIKVIYEQTAENINPQIDLVVYTAAISPDNPELCAAIEAGIPTMDRAVMVGQVMRNYKTAIAVSGTHGKTTTTSMMSHILLAAQTDPTISVGGMLQAIQGNLRIGKSETFLIEACEYTNSFLKFFPTDGIILNIDRDHLDFFKDLDDIKNSFRQFASLFPEDGFLVINGAIPGKEDIIRDAKCKVVTYGMTEDNDYCASLVTYDERGYGSFEVMENGTVIGLIKLNVIGIHNVSNALAATALSRKLSIPFSAIQKGLSEFCGTSRRFEYKGSVRGVTIIDDYAHHPTEIEATLTAAKNYPHKKLWCVFQPHTYSRTKALLPEFAKALCLADHVVLADIYAAREKNIYGISSETLKDELKSLGKEAYYFPSFGEIEDFLLTNAKPDDLIITMGAGNIVEIGEFLLGE